MSTPHGRQRLIDGPDLDLLTLGEVAKHLRLSERTLERLIATGKFPAGVPLSPGVVVWGWLEVVVYVEWQKLAHRLVADETAEDEARQSATTGDTRRQSATTAKRPPPDA